MVQRVPTTVPVLFFLLIFLLLFPSCEGSAPEIKQVYWQINSVKRVDRNSYEERLVFYLLADDEDGFEDLDQIYILHDDTEQYWALKSDRWTKLDRPNEVWIGSSNLVMTDNSSIPRGKYRVLIYDVSGERGESEMVVDSPIIDTKTAPYPELMIRDDKIIIRSPLNDVQALLFDKAGKPVSHSLLEYIEMTPIEFPRIRDLSATSGNQVYLYVIDQQKGYGLMSGPYYNLYEVFKDKL